MFDEIFNGLVVVFHPRLLSYLLQADISFTIEMHTVRWFVVTIVTQINRQAFFVCFLSVCTTEDVMIFRDCTPSAKITSAFEVPFYDAFTHIHTPPLEFPIPHTLESTCQSVLSFPSLTSLNFQYKPCICCNLSRSLLVYGRTAHP